MPGRIAMILLPFVVLGLYSYVAIRFRLFAVRSEGKYLYVIGGLFILLASIWGAVASASDYSTWFVVTAYTWINFGLVATIVAGSTLTAVGLIQHEKIKQQLLEEVELREGKLSVLENLQHDARGPYQLLELLNLTLREILLQFPDSCGAIFLVNRSQRMLVMGAASGFTKNETAHLEHLALGGNLISRAIELGEPSLTVQVDFHDKDGRLIDTRFQSGLVLPLCSGMERVGAIFICAEPVKTITRSDIKYLAPIAEWLAEKIRTARLSRELTLLKTELEDNVGRLASTLGRVTSLVKAISADDALITFCKGMNGVIGATSTQLYGLRNGTIVHHGGSEPTGQLSENFRTALIDALDRRKPVVINHEWTDSAGHSSIARSSLVYPLADRGTIDALILSRESGGISISDDDMKLIQTCAFLAGAALDLHEGNRRDLTRRVGIDKVLQLLALQTGETAVPAGVEFVDAIADILPRNSAAVTLQVTDAAITLPVHGYRVDTGVLSELHIATGEGLVGSIVASHMAQFVFGRREVHGVIEQFDIPNRHLIPRLFGERRLPNFVAAIPILRADRINTVSLFFLFDLPETERFEWERLFQLAGGLYSLRLALDDTTRAASRKQPTDLFVEPQAAVVNQLNNHLAAVIGNAELLTRSDEISGEVRSQLQAILAEAERAASIVHGPLTRVENPPAVSVDSEKVLFEQTILDVLGQARISGSLYMAGGRAREIHVNLRAKVDPAVSSDAVRQFFETALARFAATAADDDSLTISSYVRDNYLYLDVSRHHKNFPAVEPVAGFGTYESTEAALTARPADVFLKPLAGTPSAYAVDREGTPPAFLSFRFPIRTESEPSDNKAPNTIRILAIDDQPVILDLISAMCQSLGYGVTTASTAEVGVKLALAERFDVILTDLAMPGMSGLDVARQVRRVHPETPIILVTGWEAGIDVAKMKGAGITDVLYKPFRIEQLTDIVRSTATRKA
jgi:CheY-like chemotaxis protein